MCTAVYNYNFFYGHIKFKYTDSQIKILTDVYMYYTDKTLTDTIYYFAMLNVNKCHKQVTTFYTYIIFSYQLFIKRMAITVIWCFYYTTSAL